MKVIKILLVLAIWFECSLIDIVLIKNYCSELITKVEYLIPAFIIMYFIFYCVMTTKFIWEDY